MSIRESGDALAAYQLDSSLELVQSILKSSTKAKTIFKDEKGQLLTLEEDQRAFDPFCPRFQPTVQTASYIERIEMTGVANFGGISEVIIPPRGDFLSDLTICMTLPKLVPLDGFYADWTSSIGHALPRRISLFLGNDQFDCLEGEWLEILDQIDTADKQWAANCAAVGRYESPFLVTSQSVTNPVQAGDRTFYCRLRFGFTDDISLSLPIISLPFTEIKLRVEWRPFEECITYDGTIPPLAQPILSSWMNATYTKLDTRYSLPVYNYQEAKLAYLYRTMRTIELMIPSQATTAQVSLSQIKLPVSGLVFVLRESDAEDNNDWFNFTQHDGSAKPLLKTARLTVDNFERYAAQDETFYRLFLPTTFVKRSPRNCIYIMPFARDLLETNKASGTLDFGKIKNPMLWLTLDGKQLACRLKVYALTYNIMGVRKGQILLRS